MNQVRHYREKLSFSQSELAEKLGVSQQAVAKWETGEAMPRADKLPQLAKLLGCTADKLLENISTCI